MQMQRDKERKRARELSREDSDVLRSLMDSIAAQEAEERKRQRIRDETSRKKLQLDGLVQDVKKVTATLNAQKARLLEAEGTLSIKHSVRRYSLEDLGQGRRNCGGPTAKKARLDVLHRMSALGAGLSRGQVMDFQWFCEVWDQAGVDDFAESWPETFASWMQGLLDEHDQGILDCFSSFVHSETKRRLAGSLALEL